MSDSDEEPHNGNYTMVGSGAGHGEHEHPKEEEKKYTVLQACAFNTLNMFGTGPFITIPFVLASAEPAGPQWLLGYAVMAFGCCVDSLIWSELGSRFPESGGSYVYLNNLFGKTTFGRFLAFIYVWQFLITAPMEIASGNIAIAQYLAYIDGGTSYWHHSGIAFCLNALTVCVLYQGVSEVGKITLFLWGATIGTIVFTLVVGFSNFNDDNLSPPPEFSDSCWTKPQTILSFGVAMRYAVYDFTGYYDVCQMGGEVVNPRKTIPIACTGTCITVAIIYGLTYLAVIGYLPWAGPDGFVAAVGSGSNEANFIMALFFERLFGRSFAIFSVIVVCICIFGANFAFTCGCAYIPAAAADGGHFFSWLGHRHETRAGLADYSLLTIGFMSCCFCFLQIEWLIQAMMTLMLLVQFMGQSIGLLVLPCRTDDDEDEDFSLDGVSPRIPEGFSQRALMVSVPTKESIKPWMMPFFPLPIIIQLVIFGFAFVTSDKENLCMAGVILTLGCGSFLVWAWYREYWPFEREDDDTELTRQDSELEDWESMELVDANSSSEG